MGCSTSCSIFESFSTALEWIAISKLQASAVLHILDDFLFIAATEERCTRDLGPDALGKFLFILGKNLSSVP